MANYKLILADDHAIFREGVKKILEETKDLRVIGEVSDGLELLAFLKKQNADMIILDISMPNLRGIEATREAKGIRPGIKVLILTMHKNVQYLANCIDAGANGYLLKEDSGEELIEAITKLRKGGRYISRTLAMDMTEDFFKKREQGPGARADLSIREREVLKFVAEGKSSKKIGELLYISSRTAEHHRASLKKKLRLRSTAELVKYAIKEGYTTLDEP
ncbi:MAG: response regulator transcription factor [Deltaproteobacteria bacterium]|nr:response regulator transcription factor [Deltaproteobacteria bacterium]